MDWVYQKQDSTCFVIAALNAYKYVTGENLYKENYEELVDLCKCRTGNIIDRRAVIDSLGLRLKPVCNYEGVKRRGGILTIMHPIFNLHAVFCYPVDDTYGIFINSWLGPVEMKLEWGELEFRQRRLPKNIDNRDYWGFRAPLVGE